MYPTPLEEPMECRCHCHAHGASVMHCFPCCEGQCAGCGRYFVSGKAQHEQKCLPAPQEVFNYGNLPASHLPPKKPMISNKLKESLQKLDATIKAAEDHLTSLTVDYETALDTVAMIDVTEYVYAQVASKTASTEAHLTFNMDDGIIVLVRYLDSGGLVEQKSYKLDKFNINSRINLAGKIPDLIKGITVQYSGMEQAAKDAADRIEEALGIEKGHGTTKDTTTMTMAELMMLPEYSSSLPTGTAIGKRWRRKQGTKWLTGEYVPSKKEGCVDVKWLEVKLIG